MLRNRGLVTLGTVLYVIITAFLLPAPVVWAQVKYTSLHKFTGGADGGNPSAGLIFDAAGNLYGTTDYGGNGSGVVFKLTPKRDGRWAESVLYVFCAHGGNCSDGYDPVAARCLSQRLTSSLGEGRNSAEQAVDVQCDSHRFHSSSSGIQPEAIMKLRGENL